MKLYFAKCDSSIARRTSGSIKPVFLLAILAVMLLFGCRKDTTTAVQPRPKPGSVDAARLEHADRDGADWLTYGRTYTEQRFSPLKKINDQNVGQLGLTWSYDLDTRRGQEATPLIVDGVMYFTTAWSKIFALDAATGAPIWSYDPKVPPEWSVNACCDVVNRGAAVWHGKIYFATLDGRLIALDAATGAKVWETLTIDPKWRYTITGAPRIVKGRVLIGNGGGEMGVRGYVSAYNAETGELAWRFYTIPGDPAKPPESPALAKAAKTWSGEWWKIGGGGTVWDAIVYDPELDVVYIGTGNGGPWNEKFRSPRGGDNLFTGCVIALKPDTGEYVWHYQEVPNDDWDYDSDEQIILADVEINGRPRKVLFHAPKDGFFYVIDRETGALISAKPYTYVNWASGIDPKSGRPVVAPNARYPSAAKPMPIVPGPLGAHSWQPMSYSPATGLVYIPIQDAGFFYKTDPHFEQKTLAPNDGIDFVAASLPQDPKVKNAILSGIGGELIAWDPLQQKQAWTIKRREPWNGGALSTAGNLVFEGTADGHFEAYRADNGAKLWSVPAQTGVMAGPVTYEVAGDQYVAVLAGWGGVFPLATGEVALKAGPIRNISRMLVYKIGGQATLPPAPEVETPALKPPPNTASAATVAKGQQLYQRHCGTCHGDAAVSGGVLPDLRYSSALASDQWFNIVLDGLLQPNGMVSFSKELSREDAEAIRAYVIFRANQAVAEGRQGKALQPKAQK